MTTDPADQGLGGGILQTLRPVRQAMLYQEATQHLYQVQHLLSSGQIFRQVHQLQWYQVRNRAAGIYSQHWIAVRGSYKKRGCMRAQMRSPRYKSYIPTPVCFFFFKACPPSLRVPRSNWFYVLRFWGGWQLCQLLSSCFKTQPSECTSTFRCVRFTMWSDVCCLAKR